MSSNRLSPVALMVLAALPMLAILPFRATLEPAVLLVAFIAAVAAMLFLSGVAWRRLDETAREAHKAAWFWGGMAGLLFSLVGLTVLLLTPGLPALESAVASLLPFHALWSKETSAFVYGAVALALAQALIYGLVWCGWWLRRR